MSILTLNSMAAENTGCHRQRTHTEGRSSVLQSLQQHEARQSPSLYATPSHQQFILITLYFTLTPFHLVFIEDRNVDSAPSQHLLTHSGTLSSLGLSSPRLHVWSMCSEDGSFLPLGGQYGWFPQLQILPALPVLYGPHLLVLCNPQYEQYDQLNVRH